MKVVGAAVLLYSRDKARLIPTIGVLFEPVTGVSFELCTAPLVEIGVHCSLDQCSFLNKKVK